MIAHFAIGITANPLPKLPVDIRRNRMTIEEIEDVLVHWERLDGGWDSDGVTRKECAELLVSSDETVSAIGRSDWSRCRQTSTRATGTLSKGC
jgi:hypothetical protein